MKAKHVGVGRLTTGVSAAVLGLTLAMNALAADLVGQPTPGGIGLQPAASVMKHKAIAFHDHLLLPIITAITLFVLALLLIVVVRFNKRANPVPARWSHNTPIEIAWTLIPVLILTVIAIPSFKLLYEYHTLPETPYMTVKATGHQWTWSYEYPDQKIPEYYSTVLTKEDADKQGAPYLLSVDNPLVAPVGKTVRVLVTGADVIHSFAVPAFGIKIDAVPGKVNETWFKAEQVGDFRGQCSQLCGVDHAFMPIDVHVVSQADFDAWVASKAPKPVAVASAASPASTAATPAAAPVSAPPAAAPAAATAR